jgi:hypothetical protein
MTRSIFVALLCFSTMQAFPQQGQMSISRIDQMPDSPSPLQIRDWKAVAHDYDSFVFNLNKAGQYLPVSRLGTEGQCNYANNTPLFLDSYVGVDGHLNQAEAINIMPAIVGASLAGIDKSNQNGMNWVSMAKDFFNLKNGQDVYLNNYSTTSGSDWWYDIMPNVYFYQLHSLYPDAAPEFDNQFTTVADRWLNCVNRPPGCHWQQVFRSPNQQAVSPGFSITPTSKQETENILKALNWPWISWLVLDQTHPMSFSCLTERLQLRG